MSQPHCGACGTCARCRIAAKDERYAKLWDLPFTGEALPKPAARKPLPCGSLGDPTGQTRPCQACGGKTVEVPLHACATYGVCTTAKVVTLDDGTPVKCCGAMCPGYRTPEEPDAPTPRPTQPGAAGAAGSAAVRVVAPG